MARRIELKVINGVGPAFAYGEVMQQILRYGPKETGLLPDEVIRAVAALGPLELAMTAEADSVTFTEEQWQTLVAKLRVFPFLIALPEIAEFILAIRNAPEIT